MRRQGAHTWSKGWVVDEQDPYKTSHGGLVSLLLSLFKHIADGVHSSNSVRTGSILSIFPGDLVRITVHRRRRDSVNGLTRPMDKSNPVATNIPPT